MLKNCPLKICILWELSTAKQSIHYDIYQSSVDPIDTKMSVGVKGKGVGGKTIRDSVLETMWQEMVNSVNIIWFVLCE